MADARDPWKERIRKGEAAIDERLPHAFDKLLPPLLRRSNGEVERHLRRQGIQQHELDELMKEYEDPRLPGMLGDKKDEYVEKLAELIHSDEAIAGLYAFMQEFKASARVLAQAVLRQRVAETAEQASVANAAYDSTYTILTEDLMDVADTGKAVATQLIRDYERDMGLAIDKAVGRGIH